MDAGGLLSLRLGLQPPWDLLGQRVDASKPPSRRFSGCGRRPGSRTHVRSVDRRAANDFQGVT